MTNPSPANALVLAAARAYEAAQGNPLPEPVRAVRWRIAPRVAASAVTVLLVLTGALVWSARPQPVQLPPAPIAALDVLAPDLWIHVAGEVNAPGLYEVDPGARVADAISAAGGATSSAGLDGINLARQVFDGEQIVVPALGEEESGSGLVNINRANAGELEDLPGIGPVLAQRIIKDREANGPYATVSDLGRVSGVGAAVLDKIAGLATV